MGGHGALREDPAIPRYDAMRENAHKGFKWTRGTVRTGIVGLVIIPVATYFAVRKFDDAYSVWGVRKDVPLNNKERAEYLKKQSE